jgi:hypothetical protein
MDLMAWSKVTSRLFVSKQATAPSCSTTEMPQFGDDAYARTRRSHDPNCLVDRVQLQHNVLSPVRPCDAMNGMLMFLGFWVFGYALLI